MGYKCTTFRTFTSLQAARDYRYTHGTGGWIFAPEPNPDEYMQCILFPPEMTASDVFNHSLTKGRDGLLIGS
jgi:hypothetical protein